MGRISILCGDAVYAGMLAAELSRRGYAAACQRGFPGSGTALIDLDSQAEDVMSALPPAIPAVTFSVIPGRGDLTRPFELGELTALLDKTVAAAASSASGTLGGVSLDGRHRRVYIGADAVSLSEKEYDLFAFLYSRAGQLVTKDDIKSSVWEPDTPDGALRVYIRYLRAKLEEPYGIRLIHSVRKKGYILNLPR